MGQVIQIDEARIRNRLGEMMRCTVEEALNAVLDAQATAATRPTMSFVTLKSLEQLDLLRLPRQPSDQAQDQQPTRKHHA